MRKIKSFFLENVSGLAYVASVIGLAMVFTTVGNRAPWWIGFVFYPGIGAVVAGVVFFLVRRQRKAA